MKMIEFRQPGMLGRFNNKITDVFCVLINSAYIHPFGIEQMLVECIPLLVRVVST